MNISNTLAVIWLTIAKCYCEIRYLRNVEDPSFVYTDIAYAEGRDLVLYSTNNNLILFHNASQGDFISSMGVGVGSATITCIAEDPITKVVLTGTSVGHVYFWGKIFENGFLKMKDVGSSIQSAVISDHQMAVISLGYDESNKTENAQIAFLPMNYIEYRIFIHMNTSHLGPIIRLKNLPKQPIFFTISSEKLIIWNMFDPPMPLLELATNNITDGEVEANMDLAVFATMKTTLLLMNVSTSEIIVSNPNAGEIIGISFMHYINHIITLMSSSAQIYSQDLKIIHTLKNIPKNPLKIIYKQTDQLIGILSSEKILFWEYCRVEDCKVCLNNKACIICYNGYILNDNYTCSRIGSSDSPIWWTLTSDSLELDVFTLTFPNISDRVFNSFKNIDKRMIRLTAEGASRNGEEFSYSINQTQIPRTLQLPLRYLSMVPGGSLRFEMKNVTIQKTGSKGKSRVLSSSQDNFFAPSERTIDIPCMVGFPLDLTPLFAYVGLCFKVLFVLVVVALIFDILRRYSQGRSFKLMSIIRFPVMFFGVSFLLLTNVNFRPILNEIFGGFYSYVHVGHYGYPEFNWDGSDSSYCMAKGRLSIYKVNCIFLDRMMLELGTLLSLYLLSAIFVFSHGKKRLFNSIRFIFLQAVSLDLIFSAYYQSFAFSKNPPRTSYHRLSQYSSYIFVLAYVIDMSVMFGSGLMAWRDDYLIMLKDINIKDFNLKEINDKLKTEEDQQPQPSTKRELYVSRRTKNGSTVGASSFVYGVSRVSGKRDDHENNLSAMNTSKGSRFSKDKVVEGTEEDEQNQKMAQQKRLETLLSVFNLSKEISNSGLRDGAESKFIFRLYHMGNFLRCAIFGICVVSFQSSPSTGLIFSILSSSCLLLLLLFLHRLQRNFFFYLSSELSLLLLLSSLLWTLTSGAWRSHSGSSLVECLLPPLSVVIALLVLLTSEVFLLTDPFISLFAGAQEEDDQALYYQGALRAVVAQEGVQIAVVKHHKNALKVGQISES